MLRGLWKLTWLEIKIFLREPMGAFGSIILPVLLFVVVGRILGGRITASSIAAAGFVRTGLPVFASIVIALSAVTSLVTIISIYREGGILKRLRATPVRPQTILTAHVIVKLLLSVATLALMMLAGKRYYPVDVHVPVLGFTLALLISTWSILSIGFVIASIVPTARFAQPIGTAILYPMIGVCGLFVPVQSLPPALQTVAHVTPLTYAVSLLQGIWKGEAWSAHWNDVAALVAVFVICTSLSAKVFRWERVILTTADDNTRYRFELRPAPPIRTRGGLTFMLGWSFGEGQVFMFLSASSLRIVVGVLNTSERAPIGAGAPG